MKQKAFFSLRFIFLCKFLASRSSLNRPSRSSKINLQRCLQPALLFLLLAMSGASFSQSRMKPFIGIHATGDAEMYYIGPSIQAGSDLSLNQNFILSGYLHFFPRQIDRTYENGEFEKGSYRTFTAAILLEKKWRKRYDKGFFLAGGLAYQYLNDDFSAHFANWHRIRHILLPALRTGYSFPIGKHQLTAELNATGPSFYKLEDNGFTSNVTEILSQISIGTRFIF